MAKDMDKLKLVIDCDAGTDDAQGIMMALSAASTNHDLLAITCISGNTLINKVCRNVLYILDVCRRGDIPVYRGVPAPLLASHPPCHESFHGSDGLGDALSLPDLDENRLEKEHASNGLIQLSLRYPHRITLVALGPLTNVALAQKLDPSFSSRLHSLYIMGGNTRARGNMPVNAEFNFHRDPEACKIVLNEFPPGCPVMLVPWETCQENYLPWEWAERWTNERKGKRAEFNQAISKRVNERRRVLRKAPGFFSCDAFCVAVALNPEVIKSIVRRYVGIELGGEYSRGQTVVDWGDYLGREENVSIVETLDKDNLRKMFEKLLME